MVGKCDISKPLSTSRDKLFISGAQFSLTSASRTLESFRLGVLSSDDARPVIGLQKEERKDLESIPLPKQQPDMKWMTTSKKGAISTPPGRYAQLYNNLSGKYAVVFVKLDASTGDAYIARRIVNRFGLSTSGYNPISACGSFVDLICEPTPGKAHKLYRFRILDTCLFDICAGLGLHPCS